MNEFTIEEAARRIGITPRVVRYRVARGLLPARRVGARVLVIPADAVETAAAHGKLPAGRKPGPKPKPRTLGPLDRGRKAQGT